MYLSRVEIDFHDRLKIKQLKHLGVYHSWVESSFPYQKTVAGNPKRKLWRIDHLAGHTYLLVVSEQKPDLIALSKFGVPNTAQTKNYDRFLDSITNGEIMRFRLTANPVHRVKGRLYPHVTVQQQRQWLLDRAEEHGFSIIKEKDSNDTTVLSDFQFDVVDRDYVLLKHRINQRVKLSRVSFEGFLRVENVEAFKKALVRGIGKEKAYGMGLLTVIPMELSHV